MGGWSDIKLGKKVRVKKQGDHFGKLAVVEDPGKDGLVLQRLATVKTETGERLRVSPGDIEDV